jgi:hypothetical protein
LIPAFELLLVVVILRSMIPVLTMNPPSYELTPTDSTLELCCFVEEVLLFKVYSRYVIEERLNYLLFIGGDMLRLFGPFEPIMYAAGAFTSI